jgi:phenylacetate-coenzyme A ligase PaaK-like adenylate-forming protein
VAWSYNPGTMPSYEDLRAKHAAEYQVTLPAHIERLAWQAERIDAERERGLRALIRVAKERSPWHRERLAHVDADRVTEADLASIPPMTKADMMGHFDAAVTDPRLTRDTVESHLEGLTTGGYLFDTYTVVASGGSSGTRGVFVYDWAGWLCVLLSFTRWRARAQIEDPNIGVAPVGAAIAGGKASHISNAIGQTLGNAGGVTNVPATLPVQQIVEKLNELRPVMLLGYPSVMAGLAREAEHGRLRIAPEFVVTIAEPLLDEMRTAITSAWQRPVFNCYGSSEGASGSACGRGRGMHLNEDLCIFEPVDTEGRPVPPGERAAKLYITQLFNHAQPLIRYELTDEVTLLDDGPCACGSGMRRIDDIGGRSDDLFAYPDGITVHPIMFRSPLGRERHIIEYQVRQTACGADVAMRTDGPVDVEALRASLEDGLSAAGMRDARVNVEILHADFERQATGKFKRFFPLT